MSTDLAEITKQALALPPADRTQLAQQLLASVDGCEEAEAVEWPPEVIAEVKRRDAEMSSGEVTGRPFDEAIEAARKAIQCD